MYPVLTALIGVGVVVAGLVVYLWILPMLGVKT